jgi:hypothetical protein
MLLFWHYLIFYSSSQFPKAIISFMSVCSSVRMEELSFHWTDFDEILYLNFFSKLCREYENFFTNLTKITGSLRECLCTFIMSRRIILRMRSVLANVVEKIKTHILCSINFSRKSCCLWDNVEKFGTARETADDNSIRRMRYACCVSKATSTHLEYVILIAFPR